VILFVGFLFLSLEIGLEFVILKLDLVEVHTGQVILGFMLMVSDIRFMTIVVKSVIDITRDDATSCGQRKHILVFTGFISRSWHRCRLVPFLGLDKLRS
jgi:hypothetical protein